MHGRTKHHSTVPAPGIQREPDHGSVARFLARMLHPRYDLTQVARGRFTECRTSRWLRDRVRHSGFDRDFDSGLIDRKSPRNGVTQLSVGQRDRTFRRGDREAEGAALEMPCGVTATV